MNNAAITHKKNHNEQSRQNAACATLVEANQRKRTGIEISNDHFVDQISADDEERIHTQKAATWNCRSDVIKNNENYGYESQSINLPSIDHWHIIVKASMTKIDRRYFVSPIGIQSAP